jgi:hypothetical protein
LEISLRAATTLDDWNNVTLILNARDGGANEVTFPAGLQIERKLPRSAENTTRFAPILGDL